MPLIFRLESKDGIGPYYDVQSTGNFDRDTLSHFIWNGNDRPNHVTPLYDETLAYDWCLLRERGREFRRQYYFGFSDLVQFREWFTADDCVKIKQFEYDKFEYRISIYQMDEKDRFLGDSQAIFLRDNAVMVGRIDPYDLEDSSNDMKLINDNIRWYKNHE